ncbi:MAG: cytochrome c [Epsilonproteobacteria bacterium]|nr:cytochrome c [Campylobacterota bacterium]
MVKQLLLFLPLLLFSTEDNISIEPEKLKEKKVEESFLLEFEYGRMLYNNPRGISCSKCHGKEGQGGHKIAKYYDKDKNPKILKGVDITGYSLKDLEASLSNRYRDKNNRRVKHKVMPMYYLTKEEINAIYTYLQEVKNR